MKYMEFFSEFFSRGSKVIGAALLAATLAGTPAQTEAAKYELIRSPQTIQGSFTHNVFTDGSELADDGLPSGTGGNALGWFTLDSSKQNWYDPVTGEFNAYFLMFSDAGAIDPNTGSVVDASKQIGSVHGVGEGIYGLSSGVDPNLGDNEDVFVADPDPHFVDGDLSELLVGYIDWSFSGALGNATHRTQFADHDYTDALESVGGTTNTFRVNSESSASLFLFGSSGTYAGNGMFNGSNFTVDMVLEASTEPLQAVPEPGTVVLLATGLVGLIGYRRRQQR